MSERTGIQDGVQNGVQDGAREGEPSGSTPLKILFEISADDAEEDLTCDNTPVFSTFFQDALDRAACTKGIAPKWRRGEDGSLQLVLSPPPPPPPTSFEYAVYLLRKSQPFSVFAKTTSPATGLLGKVLAMSRASSTQDSTSTVSEKRRRPPPRRKDGGQRLKDGGYYLKVPQGPRQRSSPRKPEPAISIKPVPRSRPLVAASSSPRRRGPRDFLRRLTGDESIGRLYSDHTGQHLRLRSFHELSHERTERLSLELESKTGGKQCNQPGAKFAARNSARRERERRRVEVDENKNEICGTKLASSQKSPSGGDTSNTVRWRRTPLEGSAVANGRMRSGKTSAVTHSAREAIFKMPAQSSDSKCKEWIFKNCKFFAS